MNLLEIEDKLKNLSDLQLHHEMISGVVPGYLALAEFQRRRDGKLQEAAQQKQPPPLSETIPAQAMSLNRNPNPATLGIPAAAPFAAPLMGEQPQPQPVQQATIQPQSYVSGGLARQRYAPGGIVAFNGEDDSLVRDPFRPVIGDLGRQVGRPAFPPMPGAFDEGSFNDIQPPQPAQHPAYTQQQISAALGIPGNAGTGLSPEAMRKTLHPDNLRIQTGPMYEEAQAKLDVIPTYAGKAPIGDISKARKAVQQEINDANPDPFPALKDTMARMEKENQKGGEDAKATALLRMGLGMMGTQVRTRGISGALEAAGQEGGKALTELEKYRELQKEREFKLFGLQAGIATAEDARNRGNFAMAQQAATQAQQVQLAVHEADTKMIVQGILTSAQISLDKAKIPVEQQKLEMEGIKTYVDWMKINKPDDFDKTMRYIASTSKTPQEAITRMDERLDIGGKSMRTTITDAIKYVKDSDPNGLLTAEERRKRVNEMVDDFLNISARQSQKRMGGTSGLTGTPGMPGGTLGISKNNELIYQR